MSTPERSPSIPYLPAAEIRRRFLEFFAERGHTIVPAVTAGIAHRVGSLEKGKDADIVVISGDPSDPRSHVELVLINGRVVYDPKLEPRRF